jgi:hypothetical protein
MLDYSVESSTFKSLAATRSIERAFCLDGHSQSLPNAQDYFAMDYPATVRYLSTLAIRNRLSDTHCNNDNITFLPSFLAHHCLFEHDLHFCGYILCSDSE